MAFLMAQAINNPPSMQETQGTQVQSLSREDPLEEKTATHSSILAWKIPWTEEPGGLQSRGLDKTEQAYAVEIGNRPMRDVLLLKENNVIIKGGKGKAKDFCASRPC